jgi:hypothetical protein
MLTPLSRRSPGPNRQVPADCSIRIGLCQTAGAHFLGSQAAVIPEKDLFYYDNKWFLLIFALIDACNKGVKHEIMRNRQFIMENKLYGNLALFAQCATARKTSIFGGF